LLQLRDTAHEKKAWFENVRVSHLPAWAQRPGAGQ
jgi:hypothetical protein